MNEQHSAGSTDPIDPNIYRNCLQGLRPISPKRLREAIAKAADLIEKHPRLFNFHVVDVPHSCKSPGCALGWIHFFSKVKGRQYGGGGEFFVEASHLFDVKYDGEFYARMDVLNGRSDLNWRFDPAACAQTLRRYAEMYV